MIRVGADAHIGPAETADFPKIQCEFATFFGPMRCPQASFEAQPRSARLLAPKMGIGPYAHFDGLTEKQKILASLTVSALPLGKAA